MHLIRVHCAVKQVLRACSAQSLGQREKKETKSQFTLLLFVNITVSDFAFFPHPKQNTLEKEKSIHAMDYNFQYIDRDKLQLIINKVKDKRSMLSPLMGDLCSKIRPEPEPEPQFNSASSFDDDDNDEYYDNECVQSEQALTSDALVAPQMVTYRKNADSIISIDSMNLTSAPIQNASVSNAKIIIETEKSSAENTIQIEKSKPNQPVSEVNYHEIIHNLQEEIAKDIDYLITKITEKKYLLNQKSAFGTTATQTCKHTKSFCEDYLNRIQGVYSLLSARESKAEKSDLKSFAKCHHSILKGLKAFDRYFNNAFNNSSIGSLGILLIYAEKMTTKFMKCVVTVPDQKYFETTSILSRKLLRVIDIIDDLKKRSSEKNATSRKKDEPKQTKKALDVYGGGKAKVAVKRKVVKKMSVDVTKTKVTKSKQKPGEKKGAKRELVTISEEKSVRIAVAENISANVEQNEWRKRSLLLIEELNEVAIKCNENVSESNEFINKNQLIDSLRYFAKKFSGQPMDSTDGFPSILSSSRTSSQIELQPTPPTEQVIIAEECSKLPVTPASAVISVADSKTKSMTCEEIFRPTKNVQLLYLRSHSDILDQTNHSDDKNRIRMANISLDEMVEHRNKFVGSLKKKSMYRNKHFGRPWKVLSIISDNIMNEIIESILAQLKTKEID